MSSADVATLKTQGSDPKSELNKQQDQAGSGTNDTQQINGKNVIGESFFFLSSAYFRCTIKEKRRTK
jgi:hypothetical protein